MDPQTWAQLAQSLGVSVACLVALSFAIWKGIKWIGINFILPIKDAHVQFLNNVTVSMREMVSDNKTQATILSQFAERMEHMAERMETVAETLTDIKKGKIVLKAETVTIQPKANDGTHSDR